MTPSKLSNERLKEQYSNINPYVKLTRLTKEDVEKLTGKKKKKENTSNLSFDYISPEMIKQEEEDDETNIITYKETKIEHTSWQQYEINVKTESTNLIEVKIEREDTESTTSSNYVENDDDNEFICEECFARFDDFEEFVIHKNLSHNNKPYVCDICNAEFVLSAHLNLHLVEHVNYLCLRNSSINPSEIQSSSRSNLTINPSGNYKNSMSTTASAKNSCNTITSVNLLTTECETQFINHHDICNNNSNTSKFHQCHLCIKSFKNYSALNGHLKYHSHRSEMISRRQLALNKKKVNNQNKNSIVNSQKYVFPKIANFNKGHKCRDCNRQFTTRRKLTIHFKQHKKQMVCNQCNKKFVLKRNFEKHMLSHSNGLSNNISLNESNSQQNQRATKKLMKHKSVSSHEPLNVSEQEKSFQCSYCNNYCKSKQSLSQHKRHHHSALKVTHRKLKSKTVECNWCSIVITKCNLLRHIKSLHPNINPIKCSHCPTAFKDNPSLKLHVFQCHTNKV
ncbi:hypothetical protein AGLY_010393 [Aphis glycines]|uniref:C2H2-type domain-containing protein n=1 Tax=Aphis glycines TaxID=307491 RepID=A0A6G0TGH6_APHGL|nr:hypothetical protein AGLY_010393 [Aphis glycines]